jgi:hypothetical protein
MPEVLFFPLSNEHGFKVDCKENYQHMIHTIIKHTIELQPQFPDNPIYVVYRIDDGN